MKTNILKMLMISLLVVSFSTLTGCNTVKGVGKDVQATGKAIQKSAR